MNASRPEQSRTRPLGPRTWRQLFVAMLVAVLAGCGGEGASAGGAQAAAAGPETTARGANAADARARILAAPGVVAAVAASDTKFSLAAAAVTASGNDGNVPANTVDNNATTTRWSAEGDGQWIQYDLGSSLSVGAVKVAWYRGDSRRVTFDLLISADGATWVTLLASRQSSGTTAGFETYDIPDTTGRYVRIVGHGNSVNSWNSILETEVWGTTSDAATRIALATSAARASSHDGNVPGNTLDGNTTGTRWAAQGDGQWIEYDLGSTRTVAYVKIAWNKGDQRQATFDIQISADRTTWTPLLTARRSSGTTAGFEAFDFADTAGRYVRIVGHGNTSNDWNSIWETELYQAASAGYAVNTAVAGSGTVSRSPSQPTYAANSTVVLTATPAANHTFTGWSGDASGSTNPLSVVVDGTKNITANFSAAGGGSYTLSTSVSGSGSVARSPDAVSYPSGTVVGLTATPAAGYAFAGWSGAASGTSNPLQITMDADKTIVADFVATCQQVPSAVISTFEIEGHSPYSADGCSMVFEPLVAQVTTANGNGWRHEVKIPAALRVGMSAISESLRADVKVDLSPGGKTIIAQYHAQGTGTIVKVYVSDTNESGFLNSIASDGIFDVYVRIRPAGSTSEVKTALGTIRTGDSFNLLVSDVYGRVTVSAFGRTATANVDDGGASYLKFGNYLQSQNPVGSVDCAPFADCYARFGITVSKVTMTNISYSRQ